MWLFNILLSLSFAEPLRVSALSVTPYEVVKISVAPGLVSVLRFPKPIDEVRVGNPQDVKVLISERLPTELTVYLTNSNAKASNLIVRAQDKDFVFDIIPSKTNHQDLVKIKSGTHLTTKPTSQTLKNSKTQKTLRISP
jgi:hypothetical protein